MTKEEKVLKIMSNEPDYSVYVENNIICEIIRHKESGHYCGYALVSKNHPFYGVGYNDIYDIDNNIKVHGGLTASFKCGKWWALGFDCHHAGDYAVPREEYIKSIQNKYTLFNDGIYRNFEYVKRECYNLSKRCQYFMTPEMIEEVGDLNAEVAKMSLLSFGQ